MDSEMFYALLHRENSTIVSMAAVTKKPGISLSRMKGLTCSLIFRPLLPHALHQEKDSAYTIVIAIMH